MHNKIGGAVTTPLVLTVADLKKTLTVVNPHDKLSQVPQLLGLLAQGTLHDYTNVN
jgi:hypothetical protein